MRRYHNVHADRFRRLLVAAGVCLLLAGQVVAQELVAELEFVRALDLARHSPAVVLAQGQLRQASAAHSAAFAPFSAEIGTGYVQTVGRSADAGSPQPGGQAAGRLEPLTLAATFNVLPVGPVADERTQAAWRLLEAELALRDAQQQAVVDTVKHYLAALRARQEVELGESAVALARQQLAAVRARLEGGTAVQADVLDAELALSRAQNMLGVHLRQQAQTLGALSLTLGTSIAGLAGDASLPELTTCPLDQLPHTISGRLDVTRARHAVLRAELAGQIAIRQAAPGGSLTVSANATGDEQSFGMSASIDSRSFQPAVALSFDPAIGFGSGPGSVNRHDPSGLSIAVRVSVPLDGRGSTARAAAARNLEQALLQLELTEQQAWVELNNRGYEHKSADSAALLSLQVLRARQAALETAELRLELGLITEVDLLQSRHGVAEAELALARANDALLLVTLQVRQGLTLDPLDCLTQSLSDITFVESDNPAPGGENEMP